MLDGLARRAGPPHRQLKPGTVFREYQSQRHTVTVGREGFDWQGMTYPSLSAIARAITGTAWNGPRFFALREAGAGAHTAGAGANPNSKSAAGRRCCRVKFWRCGRGRMIAMRIQEETFGGLDRDSLTLSAGNAGR